MLQRRPIVLTLWLIVDNIILFHRSRTATESYGNNSTDSITNKTWCSNPHCRSRQAAEKQLSPIRRMRNGRPLGATVQLCALMSGYIPTMSMGTGDWLSSQFPTVRHHHTSYGHIAAGLILEYQRRGCNATVRSYRLTVRTLPFHGKDAGANPAKSEFNSCEANGNVS